MDRIFHRCYLIALLGFFLTALAWADSTQAQSQAKEPQQQRSDSIIRTNRARNGFSSSRAQRFFSTRRQVIPAQRSEARGMLNPEFVFSEENPAAEHRRRRDAQEKTYNNEWHNR